jgi:hypothetical protein
LLKLKPYSLYFIICLAVALIVNACNTGNVTKGGVKIPRLNPKYSYKDKEPMGGYMAYHYINSLFVNGIAEIKTESFARRWYELNQRKSLYFILTRMAFFSREDRNAMLRYVSNGNTVFISADYIDQDLLDTLGADMFTDMSVFFARNEYDLEKENTWVSLADSALSAGRQYGFFYLPFSNYFFSYDSLETQLLGVNDKKNLNLIAVNFGSGKFILHTAPAAFSNHFLLKSGNPGYLEKIFSYISPETEYVYWDNYYRIMKRGGGGSGGFSILNFFKKYPALNKALLLTLSLLLLFLAFGGKRRQRYVPEKNPKTNTTVSFTETIGRLYLQKKDNRNIAHKMITYFMDHVRNHYYLPAQQLNNDFAEALSRKSGVPEARVRHLMQLMEDVGVEATVSDMKLLELHNSIQEFIKK